MLLLAVLAAVPSLPSPRAARGATIGLNFSTTDLTTASSLPGGFTFAPPDTMGTVGQDTVVQFINGCFAVYDKGTGALIGSRKRDVQFWADAGLPGVSVSDPRIIYDPNTSRFFACQITVTQNTNNQILIARSNSSDPTGGWQAVALTLTNGKFADYPTMGLDPEGLYIGTNDFTDGGPTGTFSSEAVYSIPKADLLGTPSLSRLTRLHNLDPNTDGFTIQPVTNLGASIGHAPLVAVDNASFGVIDRETITNSATASATLSGSTHISVAATSFPGLARQPDHTRELDALDDRFSGAATLVGGKIYMVHCITSGTHDAIRWTVLNEATNALVQEGTISSSSFDYFQPSIAANSNGDAVIGFNRSGSASSSFVSSVMAVGSTSGGVITFAAPTLLKASAVSYHLFGGSGERWGDFSNTIVDSSDPGIFWTFQEWAPGTSNWGTQASEIIIPAANEFRWTNAANGTFGTGSNWLTTIAPADSNAHAIFSRSTGPSGPGYTATFAAGVTNERLSVRQGAVTLALGGFTYALTGVHAANSAPSAPLMVGEFAGAPRLTIAGGSIQTTGGLASGIGTGTGSNASVTVGASGSLVIANALNIGSATGIGTLTVQSSGAATVGGILALTGASSGINVDGGNLTAATLNASSAATVHYNTGSLLTTNLNLSSGGQVLFSPGIDKVLRTANLSISGPSKIDLSDNKMIVTTTPTGTWNGSAYTGVTGLIATGRNGGTVPLWDGASGIITSQSDATAGNLTGIGIARASDVRPNTATETATWAGQTITGTDTLVMYTYGGDANLDGKLNIDDYVKIDSGIASALSGWANGDFNYDGVVNIDDYTTVIDANIGNQTGVFPTSIAATPGVADISSVPEPIAATSLLMLSIPLLGRRRRF